MNTSLFLFIFFRAVWGGDQSGVSSLPNVGVTSPPTAGPTDNYPPCMKAKPKQWAEAVLKIKNTLSVTSVQCQNLLPVSPWVSVDRKRSGTATPYVEFTSRHLKTLLEAQAVLGNQRSGRRWDRDLEELMRDMRGRGLRFPRQMGAIDSYQTQLNYDEYDRLREVGQPSYCATNVPFFERMMSLSSTQWIQHLTTQVCGRNFNPSSAPVAGGTVPARPRVSSPSPPRRHEQPTPFAVPSPSPVAAPSPVLQPSSPPGAAPTPAPLPVASPSPQGPVVVPIPTPPAAGLLSRPEASAAGDRRTSFRCDSSSNRARNYIHFVAMARVVAQKCFEPGLLSGWLGNPLEKGVNSFESRYQRLAAVYRAELANELGGADALSSYERQAAEEAIRKFEAYAQSNGGRRGCRAFSSDVRSSFDMSSPQQLERLLCSGGSP